MNIRQKAVLLKKLCPILGRLSTCSSVQRKQFIKGMSRKQFELFREFLFNALCNKELMSETDRLRLKKCLLPYQRRLRLLCHFKMNLQDRKKLCIQLESCIPKMIKCGLPHLYHTLCLMR